LKVEDVGDTKINYVPLANLEELNVGEKVFAIGNPLGLERSVHDGIVSTLNRAYSNYQQKVISNYYKNIDKIALSRLQELVTELYLSESPAKTKKLWERVEKAISNIDIPDSVRKNILAKKNIEILAKNINDWLKK